MTRTSMSITRTFRPKGDVEAATGYVVKDGISRPYGQHPADNRNVVFHDMRGLAQQPTLAGEGFILATHPTSVTDFADHEQIIGGYLPEIGELARRVTGASKAYLQQNWVFRGDDKATSFKPVGARNSVATMQTHGILHADYYDAETAEALAQGAFLAAGASERPHGRLLGINTWRAISPPPQDRPLALLDRRTLDPDDYVLAVIGGGAANFKLNAIHSRYNPGHRFCWWSNMTPDEVLVFLQYEQGRGPTSTVMHTAFSDPLCPPGSPLRQSIEARAYVFLED